ncbi:MAG: 4-hydroxy-tetrahydrodipicolinate synthase [Deltaproteobacteria bacterium]|nr:MAG: 4-hydroxy-tetrahydrodipicolinate synthase [Deltaproteobacteria bacterium]
MFEGAIVATVTPFKNGKVHYPSLKKLIERQISSGTDGIVPCGTTGESATLSYEEHKKVIEFTVKTVKGRVPVIAGTGSNNTEEALMLTKHAKKVGADGALVITPYYNKPTQEGLYQHFKKIAETVDIPIIVYNVPSRTGVNILPETVVRLSKIDNIVGIKEASGNLNQVCEIIRRTPSSFSVLSGDDFLTYPMLCVGGRGVISVASNVVPDQMAAMYDAFVSGDVKTAQKIHYRLMPLFRALFLETNPIPAKTALGLMGVIEPELRLPLTEMSPAPKKELTRVLRALKLL